MLFTDIYKYVESKLRYECPKYANEATTSIIVPV